MSAYAGFGLWIASGVLASRVAAASPTCIFPGSALYCWSNNTMLQGAAYTGIGGTLLVVGAVVFDRWEKSAKREGRTATATRSRMALALAAAAIALFLTVAVLAFMAAPQHAYRLINQDLNPTWITYNAVEGSATIQAYAGDILQGYATVQWFNRSDGYVGVTGPGAYIVPSGDPLDPGLNDLGNGYPIPRDGAYTVFVIDTVCERVRCSGNLSLNYTEVMWMNLTGTNPTVLPDAQLGAAAAGGGSYVGAVLVTWDRRRQPPESR